MIYKQYSTQIIRNICPTGKHTLRDIFTVNILFLFSRRSTSNIHTHTPDIHWWTDRWDFSRSTVWRHYYFNMGVLHEWSKHCHHKLGYINSNTLYSTGPQTNQNTRRSWSFNWISINLRVGTLVALFISQKYERKIKRFFFLRNKHIFVKTIILNGRKHAHIFFAYGEMRKISLDHFINRVYWNFHSGMTFIDLFFAKHLQILKNCPRQMEMTANTRNLVPLWGWSEKPIESNLAPQK